MIRGRTRLLALPLVLAVGACSSSTATPAATTGSQSSVTTLGGACDKSTLKTMTSGKLTIGTDNPAYPPYFAAPSPSVAPLAPWELGDPTNGQGFESAVAYAVAGRLGFANADVTWTVVPFDNSFKPGAKTFDMYLAQVSYTADRATAVDMSDGYYFVNQAVVAYSDNPIAGAKTIADLQKYKFGAMQGTTSYDTIQSTIKPTTAASVYNSNDDAVSALKAKQIDAIVVDLPTAFIMTGSGQIDNGVVVGQFPAATGPDAEHFSIVLTKGSALTTCVNRAIAALKSDGTLDQLTKSWLSDKASAPAFGK